MCSIPLSIRSGCLLAAVATSLSAQAHRIVTGTVQHAERGTAIESASIQLIGDPSVRTVTNAAGRFSIEAPDSAVRLVALRIGFMPESVWVAPGVTVVAFRLGPVPVELDTIAVVGRADNLIGIASSASQGHVGTVDLRSRPIAREGELLEAVPGVIVTQHSGDGKANQYFIRGFNLDHGTDFRTELDGMPINLPSHAHGQGYTDLNFLIPELLDHVDYKLGVFHPELGDFSSAGGAELHLITRLARPLVTVGTGENGLVRLAGAGSSRVGDGDLLFGAEVKRYDGPWVLGENLRKLSAIARYSWRRGGSQFSVTALGYHNQWNATDQIPLRAVTDGLISRFGNLDPTDGANTQRYSLSGAWRHSGARSTDEVQLYGIYSDLSLFSNFSFFFEDPTHGDQFNQREHRVVVGGKVTHRQAVQAFGRAHQLEVGLQSRADFVSGLGLYHTAARVPISTVRLDDVHEWTGGVYFKAESRWTPWLRTLVGVRGDVFAFDVSSSLPENSGQRSAGLISPKASVVVSVARGSELYLSGGFSFHSNDARGTTITVDPSTGQPAPRVDPVVRARGAEIGLRMTPAPEWRSTVSGWGLTLDSELLFVGDAGITEPAAASRRIGVTFANFYRPVPQLALDLDVSLAHARFTGVAIGADRIPGAIENVVAGGIAWNAAGRGAFGGIRLRRFGSYPLTEDNRVRASSSSLVSVDGGYLLRSGLRVQLTVLNLFNATANDIQYYYISRLQGEPAGGVDDVHFHPVEPRQIRVALSWGF
jgi:hypothetical protein